MTISLGAVLVAIAIASLVVPLSLIVRALGALSERFGTAVTREEYEAVRLQVEHLPVLWNDAADKMRASEERIRKRVASAKRSGLAIEVPSVPGDDSLDEEARGVHPLPAEVGEAESVGDEDPDGELRESIFLSRMS